MSARNPFLPVVAVLLLAALTPGAGRAQILKDLPPVELEYTVVDVDSSDPIGTAIVSFGRIETKRGPRLEVRSRVEYTITKGRIEPFIYEEEVTLVCDTLGVTKFDTVVRAIGKERVNSGTRIGEDYHVVTTFEGERSSTTMPADVQRTDLGRFCGGYLAVPLDEGPLAAAWMLLFPAAAQQMERQKFRESTVPFDLGGRRTSAIVSRLKRRDKSSHRMWNSAGDLQILLRMEDQVPQANLLYLLRTINGVPAAESELLP